MPFVDVFHLRVLFVACSESNILVRGVKARCGRYRARWGRRWHGNSAAPLDLREGDMRCAVAVAFMCSLYTPIIRRNPKCRV